MGLRGPRKDYPMVFSIGFTVEQDEHLVKIAKMARVSKAEVVRQMVQNSLDKANDPTHDLGSPGAQREKEQIMRSANA